MGSRKPRTGQNTHERNDTNSGYFLLRIKRSVYTRRKNKIKKMDKQNREPNQNHQAVGEPESHSIQESYYSKTLLLSQFSHILQVPALPQNIHTPIQEYISSYGKGNTSAKEIQKEKEKKEKKKKKKERKKKKRSTQPGYRRSRNDFFFIPTVTKT